MIERYTSKSFAHLFDDEARYEAYLSVELAAVEAWAKLGVVPANDLKLIEEKAHVDVKRINELEQITRHGGTIGQRVKRSFNEKTVKN